MQITQMFECGKPRLDKWVVTYNFGPEGRYHNDEIVDEKTARLLMHALEAGRQQIKREIRELIGI